jgi:hypothetical protein
MAAKEPITAERLRELMHYDPTTGVFTRKIAGFLDDLGYVRIGIDGGKYKAHRLAVLYMTGKWPKNHVDHQDQNRSNNRWDNLREATHSQNMANRGAWARAKHKLKGITRSPDGKKFRARVMRDGVSHLIGDYSCPAAAHFAYIVAASKLFGEFARAR